MGKTVGVNIGRYRGYPRLAGETGADFIVVHFPPIRRSGGRHARGGFDTRPEVLIASRVYYRSRSGARSGTAPSR